MLMIKLMALLIIANGTPILARKIMGSRLAYPVDASIVWPDGRPVFGPSKSWLGLISSLPVTIGLGLLLSFSWSIGLAIAAGAMLGDLLSSFIKRRLGIAPSDMAIFLDQVPESLIPLLLVMQPLQLSLPDIIGLTLAFIVIELILSRILYRLHIRNRPY